MKDNIHFAKFRKPVMIGVLLLLTAIGGWEYRQLHSRDVSLTRIQQEVQRRRLVQQTLKRDDVPALLTGSPKKRTESNIGSGHGTVSDYYTWRGLMH